MAEGSAEPIRPETRHGEHDEPSLLDDFPPLRRMPGRMFRTRTLRSPPPPAPPATSGQLPPWRGHADRANGLGDRERSWSPGEDHWHTEISTLEPLDTTAIADTDAARVTGQPSAFMEESEAQAILARLRQCADQITGIFENLRIRTANARLSTTTVDSEAVEMLRQRLASLEETEQVLNVLENYFDICKTHLEGLRNGSIQRDEPSTQGFLVHAMPALRRLLEELDDLSNNFDTMMSIGQPGNTSAPPVEARPEVASTTPDAAAIPSPEQRHHTMLISLQHLLASTLQITRQAREMREQLKSWREAFPRSGLEVGLPNLESAMEGVEELLTDADVIRGRASRLLDMASRQAIDVDVDTDVGIGIAEMSELGWHQQQLETLMTRMETVEESYRLLAECVTNRSTMMTTTATTTEG